MKVLKGIFYTFLTAFLLLVFYFFFGGAICNDIKASHIEKEYAVMELSAEELEEFFDGYYVVEHPVGIEKTDWLDWSHNDYSKELYPSDSLRIRRQMKIGYRKNIV